jgi:DivIVA protein
MAIEPLGLRTTGPSKAVDDHEFAVVRDGYDPEAVRRYLAQVDAYVSELEEWTQRLSTRLAVAEERMSEQAELDAATVAIFEARERVLEEARARAERIEAEAAVRARQSQEEAVVRILDEARAQAQRIIATALDGVEHARRRVAGPPPGDQPTDGGPALSDPTLADVFRLSGETDVDRYQPLQPERGDVAAAVKPSRYERTSAKLPSIGEDATKVYGTLHRLRGGDR